MPNPLRLQLLLMALAAHGSGAALAQVAAPESPGSAPSAAAKAADAAEKARAIADSSLGACFRKPPAYPVEGLRKNLEGRTLVAFQVSAEGSVTDPSVLRTSGHPVLDHAALKHLNACLAQFPSIPGGALPQGRYALPMVWRIE